MRTFFSNHIFLSAAGCVVLSLALSRCSPISHSVPKSALRGSTASGSFAGGGTIALPKPDLQNIHSLQQDIVLLPTSIMPSGIQLGQMSILLSDTDFPAQFDEFRTTDEVEINLGSAYAGWIPDGQSSFRLKRDSNVATNTIGAFATVLTQVNATTWTVSLAATVTDDVEAEIMGNLASLTLVFVGTPSFGAPVVKAPKDLSFVLSGVFSESEPTTEITPETAPVANP